MDSHLLRIVILALALLAPVLLAALIMERRRWVRKEQEFIDLQYRWIDRYRSMADIVIDLVDRSKKYDGQVTRSYQLLQRLQDDNDEVRAFLKKVSKSL